MADQDTQPTSDQSFDAAFAELTRLDDEKPAETPSAAEPAAAAPETPAEPVAEAAPAADTPAETVSDDKGEQNDPVGEDKSDAGEGERAPEGVAADAAREDEDLINRLGALLAKTQATAQPQQAPTPPPQPAAAEQPQEDLISADDVKLIEEVEKDWPDVVRAVRAERNYIVHKTVDYVFKEVAKELRPLAQLVNSLAQRTHLQDLQSRVPDYDTVTDKVVAWVDKQPPYLQAAYKHVIQQGTADEVADLINRFRAEAGPAPATPASPQKKKAELPTASKQAVAALAPVSTKRSATAAGGLDPSDFDGAFAAFASKVN